MSSSRADYEATLLLAEAQAAAIRIAQEHARTILCSDLPVNLRSVIDHLPYGAERSVLEQVQIGLMSLVHIILENDPDPRGELRALRTIFDIRSKAAKRQRRYRNNHAEINSKEPTSAADQSPFSERLRVTSFPSLKAVPANDAPSAQSSPPTPEPSAPSLDELYNPPAPDFSQGLF